MFGLGIQELMVLFVVTLLTVGPKGLLRVIDCLTALGQVEKAVGELNPNLKGGNPSRSGASSPSSPGKNG